MYRARPTSREREFRFLFFFFALLDALRLDATNSHIYFFLLLSSFNIKRDTMMELLRPGTTPALLRLFILKMNRWAGHTNTHPSTLSPLVYRRNKLYQSKGRLSSSVCWRKSVEDRFGFLRGGENTGVHLKWNFWWRFHPQVMRISPGFSGKLPFEMMMGFDCINEINSSVNTLAYFK